MQYTFNPNGRSVSVKVRVFGPQKDYEFSCSLDTGATQTVLPAAYLRRLGCDLANPVGRTRIRAATGSVVVPLVRLPLVAALGRARPDFVVAANDLPIGVETNGLLGLDFYRGLVLKLDFARGRVSLALPSWWRFWR
jgi:predicted aspartyl protease